MKKALALAGNTSLYLYTAFAVFAQGDELQAPGGAINPDTDPKAIPQLIVNLLFMIAAFLAVTYLIYGGIKWITSRGDKLGVESARKHIMAAVIGLVIVAASFFALNVIFNILGACNPLHNGFRLPTLNDLGNQNAGC